MTTRFFVPFLALLIQTQTQNSAPVSSREVLRTAQIVAGNIETAIRAHLTDDPDFQRRLQLPEDKQHEPKILVKKDGSFEFDWTPGQQARYLMEQMRQGIHALQSVSKPKGMDIIALTGVREYWPKLRDISCRENPGIRYYTLDGFEEFCPD
jgi:hypothetical protein